MKKLFLIFLSLFCISCTGLTAFTQHTADPTEIKKLTEKGAMELMTSQEIEDLKAGKTITMIGFRSNSRGVVLDKLTSIVNLSNNDVDKDVIAAAKLIQNNPGAIFISDNSDIFIRTIKFLGQNEDGRSIINGARFLFINNFNENRVKELAQKYNFKYSFPKLDN